MNPNGLALASWPNTEHRIRWLRLRFCACAPGLRYLDMLKAYVGDSDTACKQPTACAAPPLPQ